MKKSYYWGIPDISVYFCEEKYVISDWVAEYENTMSAISYIIIGLIFLFSCKLKKFGALIIILGVSTMVMHGTLRYYGQWMDEVSMLVLSYETIIYLRKNTPRYGLAILVGIYTYYYKTYIIFTTLFGIMQLVIIAYAYYKLERKNVYQRVLLKLYTIVFLASLFFWLLDHFACDYMTVVNGHALWHVGTALAMLFGYSAILI
jgi:dihydroceramidase